MQCRFSPLIGLPGGRLGRAWVEASVEESGLGLYGCMMNVVMKYSPC